MSVQHIWNLFQLLGLFTCCKLVNLFWNFVTETCKQRPETIRRRLCCEKLGTSHDVKGFAIGSVLERTVVERANDGLCWKNIKNAGLVSAKPIDLLKITTKSAFFDRLIFGYVCLENSGEIGRFFREFAPKNPAKFDFFSATYQKPCLVVRGSVTLNSDYNNILSFLFWKMQLL